MTDEGDKDDDDDDDVGVDFDEVNDIEEDDNVTEDDEFNKWISLELLWSSSSICDWLRLGNMLSNNYIISI